MGKKLAVSILVVLLLSPLLAACSSDFVGGAAVGGVGVGAAYEYQNKRQMDMLEEDFRSGRINKDEYLKRKDQISKGSIIY